MQKKQPKLEYGILKIKRIQKHQVYQKFQTELYHNTFENISLILPAFTNELKR